MTITNTWAIANLERNTADNKVVTVHWTVSATQGDYSADAYGSIDLDGDVATPFENLTPAIVIGWVKDHLGAEKVAVIEQSLLDRLRQQRAPKTAAGLPW